MRDKTCMNNIMKDKIRYATDVLIIARWLARGNSFLAEELRNEMHLAIMRMDEDADKAFCLRVAKCRAIDWLRSKAHNYSYGGVIKHVSLEAFSDAGFQIDTKGNVYAPKDDHSVHLQPGENSEGR